MRLSVVLLAAALTSPLLAADPPPVGETLFPLTVGNTWTYRVQLFGGPAPSFQDDRFVVRVVRKEMIGEQTCFLLEGKLRERVAATEHVAFTKDGLTRFKADTTEISPPVTVLRFSVAPKLPLKTEYQLGDRKATATFFQETGQVNVPAGRYRGATKVSGNMGGENGSWATTTVWYAAGVGMVRQSIEEGKRQTVLELEKFEKAE